MGGNNADVASLQLDQLHMARRPSRESNLGGTETAEPQGVVRRLVRRQELGWLGELVDAHAILQHHDDALLG
jgi:hypothetical protein